MEAAGLGFGVLPLGSKVYNEIKAYVDSVKNADSETLALLDHINNGRELMELLAVVVNKNGPTNPRLERHMASNCATIQKELNAASRVVAKLRGTKDEKSIEGPASTAPDVMKPLSRTRKTFYHWKREDLKKLEPHLNRINGQFDRVLQIYNMYSSSSFRDETNHHFGAIHETLTTLVKLQSTSQPAAVIDPRFVSPSIAPLATSRSMTWKSVDSAKTLVGDSPDHEDASVCQCRPKHQVKGASGGTKWLSLYKQQKVTVAHDVGCVYHGLNTYNVERSYTVTVNGRQFWDRLSTAVAFSVDMPTSRFNSWFIAPQMRTYNLVDLERSRMMRLIDLIDDLDELEWEDPAMEKRARSYWHRCLLELFRTGKASPFDVDYRTNKPIIHFMQISSYHRMRPYMRVVWETLRQLSFPEHMLLCNGLKPWAYYFSRSVPLDGSKLYPEMLPWNIERWLEPDDIPDSLLEGNISAHDKLNRAFVLAIIMHERRSLLEASNIGPLSQAIILRSSSKALEVLDDNVSSWNEPFLGDESGICAMDLAIMWFPELMNALLQDNPSKDARLKRLPLPRPHPSKYSFLEVAVSIGLQYGERYGKATTQDYLGMIHLALERDHPVYFHRVSRYLGHAEDIVTAHLADRRHRLLEFAQRYLRSAKHDLFDMMEPTFVDEKVELILEAFAIDGVAIPEALQPRNMQDAEALSGSVFEYAWHSEDLCYRLEELGFDPEGFIRSRSRNGPFPMAPLLTPYTWDCWSFRWLCNLSEISETKVGLSRILKSFPETGSSASSIKLQQRTTERHSTGPRFLHAMMLYAWYAIMPGGAYHKGDCFGFHMPDSSISDVLGWSLLAQVEDDCDCSCTVSKCTPLSAFLKGLMSPWHAEKSRTDFQFFSRMVLSSICILKTALGTEVLPELVAMQVLRLYTFSVLECRHTCCIELLQDYLFMRPLQHYLDEEECREIHHEDSEKLESLEDLLFQFETEYRQDGWEFFNFMKSRWLPSIEDLIEKERSIALSQVEVDRIKEIGVNWDAVRANSKVEPDDDVESIRSIRLDYLETDQERWEAIVHIVDRICA